MKYYKKICIACILCLLLLSQLGFLSISVSATATKTYYVSATGTGSGLSQESPMSFIAAQALTLHNGDKVAFKRGDVFYGTYKPHKSSATDAIDIGSYGTGPLPVVSRAKIIGSPWTKVEGTQFYKFDIKNGSYKGVRDSVTNVGFVKNTDGKMYGIRQKNSVSCTNKYDFYCDNTFIYMKSDNDPFKALGTLTLNTSGAGIWIVGYTTIHDIHIRDCGYGIIWATEGSIVKKNAIIRNCLIEDIGGICHDMSAPLIWKAGNGIEFWEGGTDCTVESNIIRNCYDVGFTCQGYNSTWKNIVVKKNVFANNTQAIEIWSRKTSGGQGVLSLSFTQNICINQGQNWGYDIRPDKTGTDVLAYQYDHSLWGMEISHNTFFHDNPNPVIYALYIGSVPKFKQKVTRENNAIYQPLPSNIVFRDDQRSEQLNYSQYKSMNLEVGGSFTAVNNKSNTYKQVVSLARTSNDYNSIVKSAQTAHLIPANWASSSTPSKKPSIVTQSTNAVSIGKPTTIAAGSRTGYSETNTNVSTKQELTDSSMTLASSDTGNTLANDNSNSSIKHTDKKKQSHDMQWIVVIIVICVVLALGGFVAFYIVKKKKEKIKTK